METPHAPARTVTPAYDDFSGIDMTAFSNPYDALIAVSKDDPVSRTSAMTSILLSPCWNIAFRPATPMLHPQLTAANRNKSNPATPLTANPVMRLRS